MTDEILRFALIFDAAVTRAALVRPLGGGRKRPEWQKLILAILGGGIFGVLVIVVLRLGLGLEDAFAYLVSAVVGGVVIYLYWPRSAARHMAQIIDRLAALDAQEGTAEACFSATGATIVSPNTQSQLGWPVITEIEVIPGGTALLFGANRFVIAEACLPPGLDGHAFRTRLENWKSAHG